MANRFWYSVRYRGVRGTFGKAMPPLVRRRLARRTDGDHIGADDFDARFGLDTEATVALRDVTVLGENRDAGVDYMATHAPSFIAAIDSLPLDYTDFNFVDYGSGKGRALLLASWYPFREIMGVEFSPELNAAAERNIDAFKSTRQKCARIATTCQDATQFAIPDGPGVFYAFNPFGEPVMRKVLTKLRRSYLSDPRSMYVVYFNPLHDSVMSEYGLHMVNEVAAHRIFQMK